MKPNHSTLMRLALKSCLIFLCFLHGHMARAQLNITEWQTYGQLAEQGAVCAGFAAIMEAQDVISEDIGQLWSERRKYSGALIRNAGQLETGISPSGDEIDDTISIYREWIFANLVQTEEEVNLDAAINSFETGQKRIRHLLGANCKTVYEQADTAIFKRFPELSYLSPSASITKQETTGQIKNQLNTLLATNLELNRKLQLAENKIKAFQSRIGVPVTIETPTSRTDTIKQIATASENTPNTEKPTSRQAQEDGRQSESQIQTKSVHSLDRKSDSEKATTSKTDVKTTSVKQTAETSSKPADKKTIIDRNTENRFVIQLAAFRDRNRAETLIKQLYEKRTNLFSGTSLRIQLHSLPSGNELFRVLSTPVDRDKATALCEVLWTERIGCLIKPAI